MAFSQAIHSRFREPLPSSNSRGPAITRFPHQSNKVWSIWCWRPIPVPQFNLIILYCQLLVTCMVLPFETLINLCSTFITKRISSASSLSLGFHLDPHELHIAVKWWLGLCLYDATYWCFKPLIYLKKNRQEFSVPFLIWCLSVFACV